MNRLEKESRRKQKRQLKQAVRRERNREKACEDRRLDRIERAIIKAGNHKPYRHSGWELFTRPSKPRQAKVGLDYAVGTGGNLTIRPGVGTGKSTSGAIHFITTATGRLSCSSPNFVFNSTAPSPVIQQ